MNNDFTPEALPCAFSQTREAAIVLIVLVVSFIAGWLIGRTSL